MRIIFIILLLSASARAGFIPPVGTPGLILPIGGDTRFELGKLISAVPITFQFDVGVDPTGYAERVTFEAESFWNNTYAVRNLAGEQYPVELELLSMSPGLGRVVQVSPGIARSFNNHWYIEQTPQITAHEFGHHYGLYDEYEGGTLHPFNPVISQDGLMGWGALLPNPVIYPRYLSWFADDAETLLGGDWELVPVPEPSGILLGIAGLFCCVVLVCFIALKVGGDEEERQQ